MNVEEIKNDNDVLKFVKENYKDLKPTDTSISFIPYPDLPRDTNFFRNLSKEVYDFLDSVNPPHFIIDDFNKDGRKDLITCLYFNDECRVLSFCSSRNNIYIYQLLSMPKDDGVPYFLDYLKKKKQIVIGQVDDSNWNFDTSNHFSDRFRFDTVSYKEGIFTDYNFDGNRQEIIDTIKYSVVGSLSRYNLSIIIIDRSSVRKLMPYIATNDSFLIYQNQFVINVSKALVDSVFTMAQSLKLRQYADYYDVKTSILHGSRTITEVVYRNGKRKKIVDRLEAAPLGLRVLYNYIKEIKNSEDKKFDGLVPRVSPW